MKLSTINQSICTYPCTGPAFSDRTDEFVPYQLHVPVRPIIKDRIVPYPLLVPVRPLLKDRIVPYPLLVPVRPLP